MSDLKTIPAATVNGRTLSLHDVLYSFKLNGQLSQLVRQAVTEQLIAEAAPREGVSVTPDELQKAADGFRIGNGLNKADATQRWMTQNHLTPQDLETGLSRTIIFQKMVQKITHDKIDKHFAENRARFDRARLSRIVVADEGLAKELATQLQEDGKNFAELAKQHSVDARSKQAGGRVGIVPRKRLPPAIEQAVFGARPGAVVGPFQVGKTYHLIKVEQLAPGQLTPAIRGMIRRQLFDAWLQQQAQAHGVKIKLHECL
jgi:putative peptide maturation system protein